MRQIVACTLVLVSSFCYRMQAQDNLTVGLKVGFNSANMSYNGRLSDFKIGHYIGGFALVQLPKFAIQPEIYFSRQGFSYIGFTDVRLKSNFDYLNFPILLKKYFRSGFNLHIGPQVGFLLKQIHQDDRSGTVVAIDYRSIYKKTDLSLTVGGGWDSPIGLGADLRLNYGITRIDTPGVGGSTRNVVIQLGVYYPFIKRVRIARYSTTPRNKRKR